MVNRNDIDDVESAVKMMYAIPGFSLTLGNGKKVRGKYAPPDMSHIPHDTEHIFVTNSGIQASADDLKTLSEKVEKALQESEEERRKRKREAAKKTLLARELS